MDLIGIIGPTTNYDESKLKRVGAEYCRALIKNNAGIILTPNKNSSPNIFAEMFRQMKGFPIVNIVYNDPKSKGYGLIRGNCNKEIYCETWVDQPRILVQKSKHLLVLGYSAGTNLEMSLSRFFWRLRFEGNPKLNESGRIFVAKGLVEERYPSALESDLKMQYVSAKELLDILRTS